jgi:hypothetical protein
MKLGRIYKQSISDNLSNDCWSNVRMSRELLLTLSPTPPSNAWQCDNIYPAGKGLKLLPQRPVSTDPCDMGAKRVCNDNSSSETYRCRR